MRAKETEVEDLRRAYEVRDLAWAPADTRRPALQAGCMSGDTGMPVVSSGHTAVLVHRAQPHFYSVWWLCLNRSRTSTAGSSPFGSVAVQSAKLQAGTRTEVLVQSLAGGQHKPADCSL